MPDSNFTTAISDLLCRATSLVPTATARELYQITNCVKRIKKTDDATFENALNSRINSLLSSATLTEKEFLGKSIANMLENTIVSGVFLPSDTGNSGKALKTNGFSTLWDNAHPSLKTSETGTTNGEVIISGSDIKMYYDGSWRTIAGVIPAGVLFSTTGTHSWTVPSNVTSVSVVAIGAGAEAGATAGGGGGLGWKNNISVTPGQSYTVVVGAGGQNSYAQDSYFIDVTTVKGGGGMNSQGGGYVGDGGGNGGNGAGAGTYQYCGGGGAGGYTGNGGNGKAGQSGQAGNGSGGGGGGSMANSGGYTIGGGGVGIYGQGANGIGGVANIHPNQHPTTTGAGSGGSGGCLLYTSDAADE